MQLLESKLLAKRNECKCLEIILSRITETLISLGQPLCSLCRRYTSPETREENCIAATKKKDIQDWVLNILFIKRKTKNPTSIHPHLHRLYRSNSSVLSEDLDGFVGRHRHWELEQQAGGDWVGNKCCESEKDQSENVVTWKQTVLT